MDEKQKRESWKIEIPIEEYNEIYKDYVVWSKRFFRLNEDLIGHLMIYDDIEKVSEIEWVKFWKDVKAERIRMRKWVCVTYRKKHVNIFEKYSIDELKKLYENNGLWSVTEYFINHLNKYKEHQIIDEHYAINGAIMAIEVANNKIQELQYRSEKELSDSIINLHANELLLQLYKEDEDNHSDMYDFVINNLQYASIEDLKKLCKLNSEHFLIKGKGRKSKNKKIFKYDLKHNLLNTYVNRNACINAEQISKQSLYNVLSGKRKQLKGFIYEEEQ